MNACAIPTCARPRIVGCTVDECTALVWARGYCTLHYGRVRTEGAPGEPGPRPWRKRRRTHACAVDGCREPHRAKGYCARHYKVWRRGALDQAAAA